MKYICDLTDTQIERICKMYSDGYKIKDCAKANGISYGTCHRLLEKYGVKLRPWVAKRYAIDVAKAIELYTTECMSLVNIGRLFGCGPKSIRFVLIENGVTMRKTGPVPKHKKSAGLTPGA